MLIALAGIDYVLLPFILVDRPTVSGAGRLSRLSGNLAFAVFPEPTTMDLVRAPAFGSAVVARWRRAA